MASKIDVRRVIHALDEAKAVNLDLSLRDIVDSGAAELINSHAHLDPWDLICYTWVTFIRRRDLEHLPEINPRDIGGGPVG